MLHYAQAEDKILQQALSLQDEAPTTSEVRRAMKAARRIRQKAQKVAARRYDGLQSEMVTGYTCRLVQSYACLRLYVCLGSCVRL